APPVESSSKLVRPRPVLRMLKTSGDARLVPVAEIPTSNLPKPFSLFGGGVTLALNPEGRIHCALVLEASASGSVPSTLKPKSWIPKFVPAIDVSGGGRGTGNLGGLAGVVVVGNRAQVVAGPSPRVRGARVLEESWTE